MHPIETPDKTFHDGDGVSELGTILPAWWLNQVQSELLAVLTAAGIQPDKSQPNQLLAALNRLAVVTTGDQTITGQKTFTAQTQFQSGIHLSANQTNWNGGHKAYIGAAADNAHIVFGDNTLRLHGANNRISYNNHDIFHKANKPRFAEDIKGKPNTLSGYGIGNFKVETFRGDLNTSKQTASIPCRRRSAAPTCPLKTPPAISKSSPERNPAGAGSWVIPPTRPTCTNATKRAAQTTTGPHGKNSIRTASPPARSYPFPKPYKTPQAISKPTARPLRKTPSPTSTAPWATATACPI